ICCCYEYAGDAGSDVPHLDRAGVGYPARVRDHLRRRGYLRRPGQAAGRDAVYRPGTAPRGRADRGGPGRERGQPAASLLPAQAGRREAAGRRGGPAALPRHHGAATAEPEPGRRCGMNEPDEPALGSSESASLERGYRRLLAWYPKWFRLQNTEEVLAV